MKFPSAVSFAPILALFLFLINTATHAQHSEAARVDSLCKTAETKLFAYPDSAFVTAQKAMKLASQIKYAPGMAKSLHLIGEVFYHQGFYNESLKNLLEAEKIYNSENRDVENAENLNQLGLVYYSVRQPDMAFEKHQQALAIYERLKNPGGIAYTYGCLGRLYEKKQDYPRALAYQQKALNYYQEVNDLKGTATILENIGSIYEDQEDYTTSQDFFTRALKLNALTADSLPMIVNLNNLADGYRKTGKNSQAIGYSQQALALALRLNDK